MQQGFTYNHKVLKRSLLGTDGYNIAIQINPDCIIGLQESSNLTTKCRTCKAFIPRGGSCPVCNPDIVRQTECIKFTDTSNAVENNSVTVFCVDLSGSMQTGRRFETVQEQVSQAIDEMFMENRLQKVALIGFETDTIVYGDCMKNPIIIPAMFQTDDDEIYNDVIKKLEGIEIHPLSETRDNIKEAIGRMQAGGYTATGTALHAAVTIANKYSGGRVIIFTDGLCFGGLDITNKKVIDKIKEVVTTKGKEIRFDYYVFKDCLASVNELKCIKDAVGGEFKEIEPCKNGNAPSKLKRVVATRVELQYVLPKGVEPIRIPEVKMLCQKEDIFMEFKPTRNVKDKFVVQIQMGFVTTDGKKVMVIANLPFEIKNIVPNLGEDDMLLMFKKAVMDVTDNSKLERYDSAIDCLVDAKKQFMEFKGKMTDRFVGILDQLEELLRDAKDNPTKRQEFLMLLDQTTRTNPNDIEMKK